VRVVDHGCENQLSWFFPFHNDRVYLSGRRMSLNYEQFGGDWLSSSFPLLLSFFLGFHAIPCNISQQLLNFVFPGI